MKNAISFKTTPGWRGCLLAILALLAGIQTHALAEASVANVRAQQRAGSKLVDIYYDLTADKPPLSVSLKISTDSGETFALAATSFTGDVGTVLKAGSNKHIVWDAEADWDQQVSEQMRFKVTANDSTPAGFVYIPAGNFQMGYAFGDAANYTGETPVHTVNVSGFYMEKTPVTKALWDEVCTWALAHGYGDLQMSASNFDALSRSMIPPRGKAANHPVYGVSWSGCVWWCNARSAMDGLTPCYTLIGSDYVCNWSANGYRLPTEAEWEKAARGGLEGKRFPWGDTITHSQAGYYSSTNYSYDVSPTRGYHPTYNDGTEPYTSPVGSFAANGYGLQDMVGNVRQWCWDVMLDGYYAKSPANDPTGASRSDFPNIGSMPPGLPSLPDPCTFRVLRGGNWESAAIDCRVACRNASYPPSFYIAGFTDVSFRCVRR